MKPTCCKQVLHKRQGHSGSYCIILDLKASNELILFMDSGTKYHILGVPCPIFYCFWISTIKFIA